MRPKLSVFVAALPLALAACGVPSSEQGPVAAGSAPAAFAICKSCHAMEKGKTVIGPSLFGIVGARAGAVEGYSSSLAMAGSGLTWDDATLDAFLTNPARTVPGTRMPYSGQSDPGKRAAIIAYLKTLR